MPPTSRSVVSGHRLLLSLIAAALFMTACSEGFSREEAAAAFLQSNPEASTIEAACVVDALIQQYETEPVDEADLANLEQQLLASPLDQEFVLDQFRAMFGCGLTGDIQNQLVATLEANGLEPDQAGCVGSELSRTLDDADLEILISGQPMTDQFFEKFFDASTACDALPK